MRLPIENRVDRVDHFFGDYYNHDRKKLEEIIYGRSPSKEELQEVLWEIMPKYTRLKGFRVNGEDIQFI